MKKIKFSSKENKYRVTVRIEREIREMIPFRLPLSASFTVGRVFVILGIK